MLGVELDECPCVVDHRFDLWAAAYDCLILDQPVDPLGSELGDLDGVEVSERLADPVPLRLDHAPVHAGGKHQPAEYFEVTGKVLRSLACWRGHSAPFSDGPRFSPILAVHHPRTALVVSLRGQRLG